MTSPLSQSPFRQSLDAILLACFGWFLYCVCDAISKWLAMGYSAYEILSVSGLTGLVLCSGWIFFHHGWQGFNTKKLPWYIGRGVAQTGSAFLVIKSLAHIPMADFYGIIFLTPMVTTLLATLFLKETIGIYRIAAIAVGFIGVLIIAGPSFASHNVGYLYALMAVGFASMGAICVRKIGRETIPVRYAFFPFLACTIIFLPLALYDGMEMPKNILDASLLLLYAPIALIGILTYSTGFSRARDTAMIAPFHYTQMIWGVLLGYFIFGDVPPLTTFFGALLIIAAGLMVLWREHLHHKNIAAIAQKTPI